MTWWSTTRLRRSSISSFDPIRREVARIALSRLVQDGRIHPARIEKEVEKAQQEVEKSIKEAGEQAVIEVGLQMLHPEIVKLLGRLKYRTSYGQNQLAHAVEATHIAAMLAAELGANVQIAKMGALLHDIGKAVSHEVEGRARPGRRRHRQALRRAGRRGEHHRLAPPRGGAACRSRPSSRPRPTPSPARGRAHAARRWRPTSSASRRSRTSATPSPASRRPTPSRPAARCGSSCKPEDIDDLASIRLAKDIAKKIEDNLEYPGQIKVTVVRETRAVEMAK